MQVPAGEALNPKPKALKTSTLGRFAKIINGYKPSIYAGDSTNAALRIENGMSRFLSKKFCKFNLLIPLFRGYFVAWKERQSSCTDLT